MFLQRSVVLGRTLIFLRRTLLKPLLAESAPVRLDILILEYL